MGKEQIWADRSKSVRGAKGLKEEAGVGKTWTSFWESQEAGKKGQVGGR